MTVTELYKALEERLPRTLSCDFDRDGIMVLPNAKKEVKKALCCLDCTPEIAERAIKGEFDLVVTHHPLIFHALASLAEYNPIASIAGTLYKNDIAVFSFHTRLDCAEGGVNDRLADLFGLQSRESFPVDGQPMGRVGVLPEKMTGRELAQRAKELLSCPSVRITCPDKEISRFAVLGGAGSGAIDTAISVGADAFLTGEMRHHEYLDAAEKGLCMLTVGHDYSERLIALRLKEIIAEIDPKIDCECFLQISSDTL